MPRHTNRLRPSWPLSLRAGSILLACTGVLTSATAARAATAWGIQATLPGPSETLVTYDPLSPEVVTTIGSLGLADTQFATGLAFTPDERLWATVLDTTNTVDLLVELNTTTGAQISSVTITGLTGGQQAVDLAYNPHTRTMYMLVVIFGAQNRSFIYALDVTTAVATPVAEPTPAPVTYFGLAITSNGHVYLQDTLSDQIARYDESFAFQGVLPLGFNADLNQGMGADWSRDDTIHLAGWDAAAPVTDAGLSYTFLGDLTGYTLHGIIGGAGSANEIADVTFLPLPTCDPDFNGDGHVALNEILEVYFNFGPCPGCPEDLNGDDAVDGIDLAIALDCFGPCPCSVCPPQPVAGVFDRTITVDATTVEAVLSYGLLVTHLYATGDSVSVGDRLVLAWDASINVANTTFFQHDVGGDLPPLQELFTDFPDVRYDTFVTMNALTAGPIAEFVTMDTLAIAGGWFGFPGQEAVDISAVTGNPGDAGVLIAQITMVRPSPIEQDLPGYSGTVTLHNSECSGGDAEGITVDVSFSAADLDGDGNVGIVDFLGLLEQWGPCDKPCPPWCAGDINQDCEVGINDFLLLLVNWGKGN